LASVIHQTSTRGRQASQPWHVSYQASTLETRKQTEPMASGRQMCWCAVAADRLAAMATPVLTLKYTVPASCTAVDHQSIRPGWKTKNRRPARLSVAGAASTASR
jgi:hypothetical protein